MNSLLPSPVLAFRLPSMPAVACGSRMDEAPVSRLSHLGITYQPSVVRLGLREAAVADADAGADPFAWSEFPVCGCAPFGLRGRSLAKLKTFFTFFILNRSAGLSGLQCDRGVASSSASGVDGRLAEAPVSKAESRVRGSEILVAPSWPC